MRASWVLAFGFLGFGTIPARGAVAEGEPGFHFVLCDGNHQLHGQAGRVADAVVEIFGEMGILATWSSDPADATRDASRKVNVVVLPHSSRDWKMQQGVLATVRWAEPSRGAVFIFYPDIERALDYAPGRYQSILRGGKPPAPSWQKGIARVIAHEILHYFLPGRPHDAAGIFMSHVGGDFLMSPSFGLAEATRDALTESLLGGADP
jgi:hypothetical protein